MAASLAGSLRWVIGLPIFIAFTFCLILNAASQLLENSDPELAATLNPLNTDARINVLVAKLNADGASLDQLAVEARALVAQSSADARGYSLVGAIDERRGDIAAATASYAVALDHSRTERYALTRLLSLSLAAGDVSTATRYFDLLLRRWSEFAADIVPLSNDLIAEPGGAAALRQALLQDPAWRDAVVHELQATASGLRFVVDLLTTSEVRTNHWREDLISTLNRLLSVGSAAKAYALFSETLTPAEVTVAGYVYDAGFTLPAGRRSFDWAAISSSAVDASLPASRNSPGLRVRFLDSPAKLGSPSQMLYLPAGTYSLSVTANGQALVLPRGLYWRVGCVNARAELGRAELAEGTYSGQTVTTALAVPTNCPLQALSLETGVTTSSWRDRYRGEILITNVHISRVGAGK